MFADWDYWGKPVPNFGSHNAQLLIVGLAPAAHGANRTGRMFTGDNSGLWLYRALHRAGFANQFSYERADDGLVLIDACISAVCHCAPPDNKPTPDEIVNCEAFLSETIQSMTRVKVYLALGSIAWTALYREFEKNGTVERPRVKFSHGSRVRLNNGAWLVGSYHPSQQNTFTGRLTEDAFDSVFQLCKQVIAESEIS